MLVDFPGRTDGIVVFGLALCDAEVLAWDDDVGGVGCASPFLAVGAVAEGCYFWLTLRVGSGWRWAMNGEVAYGVFVVDFTTHATAFCHFKRVCFDVTNWLSGAEMCSAVESRCGV